MKTSIYVVKDIQADVHSEPVYLKNDAVAKRVFGNVVNNKQEHIYYTNPDDFELIRVGVYNDEDAHIEAEYEFICPLNELIRTVN